MIEGIDKFPVLSQRSEWMAPARREVVVSTISDDPDLARISTSPETGSAENKQAATNIETKAEIVHLIVKRCGIGADFGDFCNGH